MDLRCPNCDADPYEFCRAGHGHPRRVPCVARIPKLPVESERTPMTTMPAEIREQLRAAYLTMTRHDIYPGSPTADTFANWFWSEEQTDTFDVGCCDFNDRPAMAYIVTALRHLCGMEHQAVIELLGLALADLSKTTEITTQDLGATPIPGPNGSATDQQPLRR